MLTLVNILVGVTIGNFAFLYIKWIMGNKFKIPPGPPGWPLIGNLPVLFKSPGSRNDQYFYTICANAFGDIYSLRFGPQLIYVLAKFEYVQQAFSHSDIQGKPPSVAHKIVFGPKAVGFVMASGEDWSVMKQFTLGFFRELSVGRGKFENNIQLEVQRIIKRINETCGNPCWNLPEILYSAISNVMCGIIFDHQFDYKDERLKKIVGVMAELSEAMGPSAIVMTSQLLNRLPFGPGKRLQAVLKEFKNFLSVEIEKKKNRSSSGNKPTNYIDAFLAKMHCDEIDHRFNEDNLISCCMELFYAGSETTSSTLSFAALCLATHPEIQEKLQNELDAYVRVHGMPNYDDRSKLPYLQSFILENHRISTATPLGIPHVAEKNLKMFGYDIPKGTLLVPNIGSLFYNEKRFTNAYDFKPDRFINNGNFKAASGIIPFSIGRRPCTGEQLARMEIFLILVCLVTKYKINPPEGVEMPSVLEGHSGVTRSPFPYGVVFSKRQCYGMED